MRAAPGVALAVVLLGAASLSRAETLVVTADAVYPVAGEVLRPGVVLVEDGRIRAVGPAGSVRVPDGARRLAAAAVTPGFIDASTSLGLAGLYNVAADRDTDETSNPNQAGVRALDAFNPAEPLLRFALEHGVTLVQTGPGPANPIGGQAAIFRTHGRVADEMAVRTPSALVLSLGEQPKSTYAEKGGAPNTRMGTAAVIRKALQQGAAYAEKQRAAKGGFLKRKKGDPPERDLAKETLAQVATGELPAIFVAHRSDDVLTALRIAREFELRAVLAGATEAYLVADRIREADVPVLVGPVMTRAASPETLNASFQNAAILADAGVRVAIRSGYEAYVPRARLVLFEAAVAAANELGPERALDTITLAPAKILGLDADHGSLERGKVADLVLFDGDPFEYRTHVEAVVVSGEVVYERSAPR